MIDFPKDRDGLMPRKLSFFCLPYPATPYHMNTPVSSPRWFRSAVMHCFSSLVPAVGVWGLSPFVGAAVIQTNYNSANTAVPGPESTVSSTDLLQTHLASASHSGDSGSGYRYFYENPADLSLLTDGQFGGSYDTEASVFPNQVTLTFALDLDASPQGYTISSISTYANWDEGRDGQAYTVEYSLVSAPMTFLTLTTITTFNPDVSTESSTLVRLTSSSGPLAEGVASLRFVFGNYAANQSAVENGGTAYREFDVVGAVTVPEPSSALLFGSGLYLLTSRRSVKARNAL
jgi:hypothetical protein